MIRRAFAFLVVCWALGFFAFAAALPQPAAPARSDAIVVLTGGEGRITRGLELLNQGVARRLLVTGVDEQVRPQEFQAVYQVPDAQMACCIKLGFEARDTRGNGRETAQWMAEHGFTSLRLVTSDWHMRRAAIEIGNQLPANIVITRDAVRSEVSLWTLFLEYHKFLAVWALRTAA